MKNIVALGLALILGLIAWGTWPRGGEMLHARTTMAAPCPPSSPPCFRESPERGRVGSQVLTAQRIELWKSIGEIRSGESPSEGDALILLEQALKREIAERVFGLYPSITDLEATLRKLAADPADAATLARIEALFNGDHRAFLEEVAGPAFVETELWNRFREDPEIHRAARASAEDLASRARKDPRLFGTLGSPDDSFGRALIPLAGGVPTPKGNPLPRLDTLPIDLGLLSQLPAGQLYPAVVATPEAFVVLRVDRQRPGLAEVETWTIPKLPYQTWLIEQARDVSPTLDSPQLKAQVAALDPAHWLKQVFR